MYLCYRKEFSIPKWRFRYSYGGKARAMWIGSYGDLTLAKACQRARELSARVALGYDVAGEKQERKMKLEKQQKESQACALPVLQKPGARQVEPLHVRIGKGTLSSVYQSGLFVRVQDQREYYPCDHRTTAARILRGAASTTASTSAPDAGTLRKCLPSLTCVFFPPLISGFFL